MTRILNEITGQVTATCGLAMDADELRLVWANARGAAMTIDRRLSVEQFLKTSPPRLGVGNKIMARMSAQPFSLISHNHTFYVWSVDVDYHLIHLTNQGKKV